MDTIVSQTVPACSRSRAAAAINNLEIRVSGQRKRPGYRVKKGDRVFGEIQLQQGEKILEPDFQPLDVIHSDPHIILVNKPAGLVVHPGAGHSDNTLVNRLIHQFPDLDQVGTDPTRPGIVHRLDKDTSGLILVARTCHSLEFLQKEFKYHRVKKTYLALVSGRDLAVTGEVDRPVGRHPTHRKRMCVNVDTGRHARTGWQVLQRFDSACLVSVQLYTGRTHQIRVHFYDMDFPLLGDRTYQFRRNRTGRQSYPRQMLHAWQMEFCHPYSGQKFRFAVDPPQDFIRVAASLAHRVPDDAKKVWKQLISGHSV
ncbi:MAG: RluA family pseudouridine synthase [Desulfotignum sp.]|nr:RluA family pseudouridine synthase [Desulfotignum sp.]MCF8088280.1 RluA family pseudouridine synthase [Desulfotignum sp.]MCF8135957.1 RluA family pseudouridine synthase [Desulfotignum sp.]